MNRPLKNWTSYHIFYHNTKQIDKLISEAIGPTMTSLRKQKQCSKWFYIRYWRRGPHVRLRILNLTVNESIWLSPIKNYIYKYPSDTVSATVNNTLFSDQLPEEPRDEWVTEGSAIATSYKREVKKYGGYDAILLSEDFFYISSVMAISFIKITRNEYSKRFAIALDLMILTASAFGISNRYLIQFFKDYSQFWEKYLAHPQRVRLETMKYFQDNKISILNRIDQVLYLPRQKATDQNHSINKLYRLWSNQAEHLSSQYEQLYKKQKFINPQTGTTVQNDRQYWEAISSVCLAHIHMMNNRLGVFLYDEFYLGTLLYYAMETKLQ